MMERDALTTKPRGITGGDAREGVRSGALRAVARHQQERVRQRLANGAELRRRRGAGHRADVAVAGLAHVGGAELAHEVGHAQEQRAAVDLDFLQEPRAGIARAREDEDAAALGAVVDQRRAGVVAQVGAGGDGVGADARGRAGEAGGAAERGVPVGGAGRGDVAALDVEDHRQLVLVGAAG